MSTNRRPQTAHVLSPSKAAKTLPPSSSFSSFPSFPSSSTGSPKKSLERPKSRREALIEKYVARPRTHQLALDQADATIRTSSPVRDPPARRFEHVVTSAFGAGGEPAIPKGADNDWCTKGLVIAGESCSPVLRRLSHPTNYTQSYAKRRSYPHVVDLQELPAFPRYSERDTEFLESIKIRKFIAEERRNPEVSNPAPVWMPTRQAARAVTVTVSPTAPPLHRFQPGKGELYQRGVVAAVVAVRPRGHYVGRAEGRVK